MKNDRSTEELKLFEAITAGDELTVRALLSTPGVRIECEDDEGMTPLQHAAYKGNADLCELLLEHGADVNTNGHNHGYSTLTFAALSSKVDVVNLLLNAGANTSSTNSLGRTAAQMAAFVGQIF